MQIIAYISALMIYVSFALIGLVGCLAFALSATYRQTAKRIAWGIVGSFPGVFLFQGLSVPFVALTLFLFLGLNQLTSDLSGASLIVFAVFGLLSTFGVFAAASIAGFLVGWRVGYQVASGLSFRAALETSRILSYLLRIVGRIAKKSIA